MAHSYWSLNIKIIMMVQLVIPDLATPFVSKVTTLGLITFHFNSICPSFPFIIITTIAAATMVINGAVSRTNYPCWIINLILVLTKLVIAIFERVIILANSLILESETVVLPKITIISQKVD